MRRGQAPFAAVPVKYDITRLGGGVTGNGQMFPGGLDLTTPSLSLQPGALRDVVNFECSQSGGYARIQGYERFSGQPAPHNGTYTVINLDAFTNAPALGDTVNQLVSGATGVVIAIVTGAAPYIVVTKVTGTFDTSHGVYVGVILIGTAVNATSPITSLLNAQYLALAYENYRADIGPVPGSGAIRGVVAMTFSNRDNVYAFRDNAAGTACDIYKASTAGWVNVPLFNTIQFTGGAIAEPQDGDTITKGGVTATIMRVQVQSGTFGASTLAGQLVITNIVGGPFTAGAATCAPSGATLNLTGAETAIVIQPGGKYQFDKGNFSGSSSTRRIYGCDNANKAFEFDGETYAPITTGLADDRPKFIAIHKNMLFLSFESSLIHSGIGTPFKYLTTDGGGEIAVGDDITGLLSSVGSTTTATLAVFTQNAANILYGTDPTTFNLITYNSGVSALPYTAQNFFDIFMLDNMGVVSLKASLNFGNFDSSVLTKNIFPFIQSEASKTSASALSHAKSQYRLFFSDGYGLYVTSVNDQYLGACPVYFPNPVNCIDTNNALSGGEVSYFGSTDELGYVYQLDVGPSFDGGPIAARAMLAWNAIKSPRILKRFRAASIEIQSSFYAAIAFGYKLGYGTDMIGQPSPVDYSSNLTAIPFWDAFYWDNFIWDGQTLLPTDVDMTGTAENVQVAITCGTNYIESFNLNSIIYHYSMRRGLRV